MRDHLDLLESHLCSNIGTYMKIGIIISSEPKQAAFAGAERLEAAGEARGIEIVRLYESRFTFESHGNDFTVLYEDQPFGGFDALVYRPNFIEEPSLHGHIPRLLKKTGVPVLNGTALIPETKNKLAQHVRLLEAGLPMPPWAIAKQKQEALEAAKRIGFPVVLKTPFGTHGVGIFYAENAETLQPIIDYLRVSDENPSIIESFVAGANRKDVRAFVIGGKIVAAMERTAPAGDIRANAALGGVGTKTELTKEEQRIVLACAQAFELDIAGVDLLRTAKGLLLIEVNANPGFTELERATGVDIAGAIIDEAARIR